MLAAGLIFLLALGLGVWKYRQMVTSENHLAHPYVDIAHRSALLYSFATLLTAVFVELSAWPTAVNLVAAGVLVAFFVIAIGSYIVHGALRDTTNQFERPDRTTTVAMTEPEAPTSLVDVPYERNESYYFTSPDGQFHCGIVKLPTRTEAGCEGTTDPVPPRPDDCVVNWGNGIRVANEGEGAFMCSGGPVYLSDGDTAVLPAGATLSKLGYSCTTTETDVTCVNDGTGHGFTVAAGSNETF